MATTVRDLIEKALKKNSVLGRGESLSPEDATDCLEILNDTLSSWSVEGGMVFNQTTETFPLASGQTSYSIGTGGDFNTEKPYLINSMYVRIGGSDYNLTKYDQKQYSDISFKSISGTPQIYYFDNNYPLSNIFLYPVPAGGLSVTIYSRKELTEFTGLNMVIDLPAGYEKALVYNLSVESAPLYEKEASPTIVKIAGDTKAAIFNANSRNENNISGVDQALTWNTDNYNIYSGGSR